ncbi:MAG: metal-sulfur cluster assembly factor [Devosia sp.]|nr:metal-sulfur cluster assembly factor [Devosia sp.]
MTKLLPALDPEICDCLRSVLDPEIGINIVDLGLVRSASRSAGAVDVRLTLTSRACPLGDLVVEEVREAVASRFPSASRVNVELVWAPRWTQDFITDRGLDELGLPRTRTLI